MILFSAIASNDRRLPLLACLAVFCGGTATANAQLDFLNPRAQLEKAISREIAKALGVGAPIRLDVKTAFPEISDDLVGFHQPSDAMTIASPADLKNGLKPGDYAIPVLAYDLMFGCHEPAAGQPYKLARVQGKQALSVSKLVERGTIKNLAPEDLNAVLWRIEDGVTYDELPAADKQIVHDLIPDSEKDLKGDILHQIKAPYDKIRVIPGLPSFESLLASAGPAGKMVAHLFEARKHLLDQAAVNRDLPQLLFQPLPDGKPFKLDPDTGAPAAPWGELFPGVYGRLKVVKGIWDTNYLEIHVTERATSPTLEDILGMMDDKPSVLVGYAVGDLSQPELLPTAVMLVPIFGPIKQ